ncbi:MAG TPA: PqqD family protein [Acidobacteriota bacterium]|nr:PqqD family protein [Acidobacteriota bacterium]
MDVRYSKCAQVEVVTRRIAGENILVPIRGRLADMQNLFTLNEVGSYIWEQLSESTTADQIAERVANEFEIDRATALEDVEQFLKGLVEAGIVEEN